LEGFAIVLNRYHESVPSSSDQLAPEALLTSGTASLSACALAASVVTVLFANAALEKALQRRGAAWLVLKARENIFAVIKRQKGQTKGEKSGVGRIRDTQSSQRIRASLSDRPNGQQNLVPEHVTGPLVEHPGSPFCHTWATLRIVLWDYSANEIKS
jgi:hypothetical protein